MECGCRSHTRSFLVPLRFNEHYFVIKERDKNIHYKKHFLNSRVIHISVFKLSFKNNIPDKCKQCIYTCGNVGKGQLNSFHFFEQNTFYLIFGNGQYNFCEKIIFIKEYLLNLYGIISTQKVPVVRECLVYYWIENYSTDYKNSMNQRLTYNLLTFHYSASYGRQTSEEM